MDRSNPILYIIIPCYNEEEVLPATAPLFLKKIEYLIASGKISNDSKILFVNDGSKDDSLEIMQRYAYNDKRIKIIDKPNGGYGHSMNAGIKIATGEYYNFY